MAALVLVVDDNEKNAKLACDVLGLAGIRTLTAATAEEALDAFRHNAFDVVITDVSLPVMSGLDLARNLLALRPTVPIILASGYALNSVLQNLGPNVRTIVKPFEASEIDSLITDLCAA